MGAVLCLTVCLTLSGEVVEVFGPEGTGESSADLCRSCSGRSVNSGCVSGKTELLYHLLSRCVLPEAAGGLEVDVVFVDTDHSLDMFRLASILDTRLTAGRTTQKAGLRKIWSPTELNRVCCVLDPGLSTSSSSAGSNEAALRLCLSRLLVVRCSSSSQLLLTLHFLETTLCSRPSLALLLIDSISTFYWSDRSEGGANVSRQEEKLSKSSELLGRLLRWVTRSDHRSSGGSNRCCWFSGDVLWSW